MLSQLKLAFKLPAMVVIIALGTGAGVAVAAYFVGHAIVAEQAGQRLTAAADNATHALDAYLTDVSADLTLFASRSEIADGLKALSAQWQSLVSQGDATELLQQAYITANPHPAGERLKLDTSGTLPAYDQVHQRLHPDFREWLEQRGYYDIFLFDAELNNLYTVFKEADFATGFAMDGGPWAGTDLGKVVRDALAGQAGEVFLSDFAAYGPSAGAPASFIATPVIEDGTTLGVLAIQIPTGRISEVLRRTQGLGESGEIILVGQDGLARNAWTGTQLVDVMVTKVQGEAVAAALAGSRAQGVIPHHEGIGYVASAEPLKFAGVDWAIVALESEAEIEAVTGGLRDWVVGVAVAMLALAALAGIVMARTISRPVTRLTQVMGEIAADRFSVTIPGLDRADELGEMAEAVEVFRTNGLRMADLRAVEQDMSHERSVQIERIQKLQVDIAQAIGAAIEGDFSHRVGTGIGEPELERLAMDVNELLASLDRSLRETGAVLDGLARADLTHRMGQDHKGAFARLASDINAVAERLGGIVGQLRDTSGALRTATGEILQGANDLSSRTTRQAATIEETAAAIASFGRGVVDNAAQADAASKQAAVVSADAAASGAVMDEATQAMERISQSSAKISSIIGLIDDIAFQTNLLALNASVEAARAGEAGKGFAVVAVEVRRLAQSAANASSEVKALIEQSASEVLGGTKLVADAAARLAAVQEGIRSNADLLAGIAGASQAQAATIEEVNTAIAQLDEMTQHNAALVEQTNAAIEQTSAQAGELDRVIGGFVVDNPAAADPVNRQRAIAPASFKIAGGYR